MKIHLQEMTKELARRYFRQFEMDPALFADILQFRPYVYSESACDETVERNKRLGRIYWAVMLDDEPIGELVLKNINLDEQHCTLGICMRSDAFKNKGYGTQAELLALDYAFNTMELSTVYADSLIGNTRSQHVLKKVGFQDTGRDANFIYYECKKPTGRPRKHTNRRWVVPDSHIIAHLHFKRNKIFILLRSFCITVRWAQSVSLSLPLHRKTPGEAIPAPSGVLYINSV